MFDPTPNTSREWKVASLSDVATFQNGHGFYKDGYSSHGLIAIDLFNIDEEGKLRFGERDKFVSPDLCKRYAKFKLNRNDLVMVMTDMTQRLGILGKCALIDQNERYVLNQRIGRITADESQVLTRYLYYFINSEYFLKPLRALAKGAVQKYVNTGDIKENKVTIPPLHVQQRIAGILSAYDELIENSQRRIKILESMARALYREWFVHFRFPGYEHHPRVASPLGEIPKGWEVKKLGDLITYSRRATKAGVHLEERHYVPIDCLPPKSLALLEARPIEEAQSSLQLFEKGDILFGAMRPYFHKVAIAPFSGVTRTTCFVFKPAQPEWHAFATMTTFDEETVAYANSHSQGATIPYAVWDGSLSEMPIVLPSPEVLQRFEEIVAPMLSRLAQSFFSLGNLRRTRDLLLPRLLSGQIALKDN